MGGVRWRGVRVVGRDGKHPQRHRHEAHAVDGSLHAPREAIPATRLTLIERGLGHPKERFRDGFKEVLRSIAETALLGY